MSYDIQWHYNEILTFFLSFLHLLHGLLFLLSPFILLEGGVLLICGRFTNNSWTLCVKPMLSKRCIAVSLACELPPALGGAKHNSISRCIRSSVRKSITFCTTDCPAGAEPQGIGRWEAPVLCGNIPLREGMESRRKEVPGASYTCAVFEVFRVLFLSNY